MSLQEHSAQLRGSPIVVRALAQMKPVGWSVGQPALAGRWLAADAADVPVGESICPRPRVRTHVQKLLGEIGGPGSLRPTHSASERCHVRNDARNVDIKYKFNCNNVRSRTTARVARRRQTGCTLRAPASSRAGKPSIPSTVAPAETDRHCPATSTALGGAPPASLRWGATGSAWCAFSRWSAQTPCTPPTQPCRAQPCTGSQPSTTRAPRAHTAAHSRLGSA